MLRCTFIFSLLFHSYDSSVIFVQVAQQVFVAKEWVCDACNEANAKALRQEQAELYEQLKETVQARKGAEASLKTMER